MKNPAEKRRYRDARDHYAFKYLLMKEKGSRLSFLHAFLNREDIVDATLHPTDGGNRYPVVYECKTKKGEVFLVEIVIAKDHPLSIEEKINYNRDMCLRQVRVRKRGLVKHDQQVVHLHITA